MVSLVQLSWFETSSESLLWGKCSANFGLMTSSIFRVSSLFSINSFISSSGETSRNSLFKLFLISFPPFYHWKIAITSKYCLELEATCFVFDLLNIMMLITYILIDTYMAIHLHDEINIVFIMKFKLFWLIKSGDEEYCFFSQ